MLENDYYYNFEIEYSVTTIICSAVFHYHMHKNFSKQKSFKNFLTISSETFKYPV